MNYREKLKDVRKYLGFTQQQMAEEMGYSSQQSISAIENGKKEMSGVAKRNLDLIAEKYKW